MKMRWGSIVAIGAVAVISAGAVVAVAGGGRDDAKSASFSSGGSATASDGGGSVSSPGGGQAIRDDSAKSSSVAAPGRDAAATGGATEPALAPGGLGGLPTPELHAQVVKTASLELGVGRKQGEATVQEVIAAVGLVHGFVESTDQSASASRLTVRVPADEFDATLARLLDLGKQRSLEVHGQDVTGAVTDLEARLRNLRAQEGVLLELMRKATTIGDSIAVQQQLSQNQEQIEQLDGQRRALADQTAFATLTVAVTPKGAPVAGHPESSTTLSSAVADGVDAALAVTRGTLIVIGALLPLLLLGGVGVLVWRVVGRRPRRGGARYLMAATRSVRSWLVSFYDEVMRELIAAIGAALFVANVIALVRRNADAKARGARAGARSVKAKGGSRVQATGRTRDGELIQAPVGRSVAFAILGFVMMVAGIAALVA